ncbi:MAG: DUF3127 domain-containing protein [Muribaculaceae bacterium]|nr:DUF3127 domain-containing protein [Muribaculaceae bacterium]
MELEGKVIEFLGETSGTSKAGNPWKKKEWLVETFGQYPKKVKVQCFGERSDNINLQPGQNYSLSIDLESREYNGRWFTDVSVFRVQELTSQSQGSFNQNQGGFPQQSPAPFGTQTPPFSAEPDAFTPMDEGEDNLPF